MRQVKTCLTPLTAIALSICRLTTVTPWHHLVVIISKTKVGYFSRGKLRKLPTFKFGVEEIDIAELKIMFTKAQLLIMIIILTKPLRSKFIRQGVHSTDY